jgi:hypothetical protein
VADLVSVKVILCLIDGTLLLYPEMVEGTEKETGTTISLKPF